MNRSDPGEAESRGNALGAAAGGEQDSLGNAPSRTALERAAGAQPVGGEVEGVRIVADAVANGVVEAHRPFARRPVSGGAAGEGGHFGMAGVQEKRRRESGIHPGSLTCLAVNRDRDPRDPQGSYEPE